MEEARSTGELYALHMWKKRGVQETSAHMAHRKGMRIARVCAWKTSALAYDGSGKVERDPDNHSLCTFTSGKRYNCDLSASYNIGARYFIRELTKPMPATARSVLEAEAGRHPADYLLRGDGDT